MRGQGSANRVWERRRGVFPYLINVILHLDMSTQKKIFWKKWQCFSWLSVSPIISHFLQSHEAASHHTLVSSAFSHCPVSAQRHSWAAIVWLDPCSSRVAKSKKIHLGPSTLSLRIKRSFLAQFGTLVRHLSRPSLCHCNPLLGDLPLCLCLSMPRGWCFAGFGLINFFFRGHKTIWGRGKMQTYTSLMAEQVLFSLRIPVRFFFLLKKIDYFIVPCSQNKKKNSSHSLHVFLIH